MFGFEFAPLKKVHTFPSYDESLSVSAESIERMTPLVWQEHCVECAMPDCYGTCAHYKRRVVGRCRLFKYGIEKCKNKNALLGQNVVIDMNEWAKLETFFFPTSYSYKKVLRLNRFVCFCGYFARIFNSGKIRRLFYYAKEYVTRKWGNREKQLPDFLLCEVFNEEKPYKINLENRANNQIFYRTVFSVEKGYNRFLLSVSELKFQDGFKNYLSVYPEKNEPQLINFISLALVSFKAEWLEKYVQNSTKKVKCVVWDLDGTLWDGILSEDGIEGIRLKKDILEIIKFLDEKGIVNCICSKNYEENAFDALRHFEIEDLFVAPAINWNPKSQNIKKIARTLDIGLDTFVFVDDSFFELKEVKVGCPQVRTCSVSDIKTFVQSEYFDVPVTQESKNRRKSYQEIAVRNKAFEDYDDITEFLKNCNMVAYVLKPSEEELLRCYELIQRTNQLNISAVRLTFDEVKDFVSSPNYDCYRIKVSDKYGDYGLVGFAIFDASSQKELILRHFVFSCRAARKKIEQSFFEYIINKYKAKNYDTLVLSCKRTEKNQLMQTVLEESGLFEKQELPDNSFLLTHYMKDTYIPISLIKIKEI